MKISYLINPDLKPKEVSTLFINSGIKRPVKNIKRIKHMIENANLTICARDDKKLVGILRAVTDFSYCCYVSDLAVDKKYQRLGIGKKLLKTAQKTLGDKVMILLLSAPEADSFYSHIGMENIQNAWKIARKR
ncbi:GCN5-related N-acetyltransferase [Nitrosotalea devaniterrae]|uniref:GCN5-related N-acetyltransferase n=1 Tax=Nitrosotalea devaniterrae TaxID=1078905 RepID=A0A128A0B8_9ARCH|nr:GCN5-related N-acetyltransferase [Candidatus Nitrosotalea devanaterra]